MRTAGKSFLARMSLGEMIRATMFGTLTAVANDVLHIPLHVPGHTSTWWMGILIVGKGINKKFGSGIIMGIISGMLAVFMGMGHEGFLAFFTYLIPGLMLDLLALLFRGKAHTVMLSGCIGAIMSVSKLAANLAIGMLIQAPMFFLTIGLGLTAVFHALFGLIGGVLAAIILKRLEPRLKSLSS